MAPTPTPAGQPDDAPEAYVGLDADRAERRARSRGWSTVRSLPPGSVITMEYLEGRLNFEVDGGTVVRCWTG
ncbi:proteinase inhibitor I78 [Streptomyces spongiicola]|uniref:Proteinase inhibitor I78 n=1 Tax=Streptomyces spongiicola TaxID=1690221 RepID=A0A2S1YWE5_9ACTN|nr:I78 family peptidase inhibitor [Streptomyces spongiicola]AWK08411.1 proteinase inhibitor I78 [Streptomyces spongiicola]GBQ01945.1 proteinase inhibitor I78 [Streptomyces spongiicola]